MAKALIFSLLFLSLFSSNSFAQTSLSPSTICNLTPFPSFCRTVLPITNPSSTIRDYSRLSLQKSLSSSRDLLSQIRTLLRSSNLSISVIRALQDCNFLAESNVDNIVTSTQSLDTTTSQVEDIQTLLSATLTNTQTCIDSLESLENIILTAPLSNNARFSSVSLALFTKGWVLPNGRTKTNLVKRKNLKLGDGRLNLKMSAGNEAIYRAVSSRRRILLQGNDTNSTDQVLVSNIVVVSQDGAWNFTSINDAVNAAPNNTINATNGYFMIYVTAGVYEEYVTIPKNKKYLMMLGEGINQTIITGNHSVVDGWTTFNSGTFTVMGTGFFAVGITFRNTAGSIKHQAVAVRNSADLTTFYSCSFEAYQDTLYVHSLRQFYSECDIYGTVDFIFGNAAVVFQNCNLYPRRPMSNQFNAITAQGRTDPNQNTGISFHNCTIRAADDLANSNVTIRTYLGRPWKEYSRTVYMQSFMDSLIHPSGWSVWSGDFALNTSYYAEFNNTGPGSNTSQRVTWPGFRVINSTDAANFTVSAFIQGDQWIPQTGIDYAPGLL